MLHKTLSIMAVTCHPLRLAEMVQIARVAVFDMIYGQPLRTKDILVFTKFLHWHTGISINRPESVVFSPSQLRELRIPSDCIGFSSTRPGILIARTHRYIRCTISRAGSMRPAAEG
jgi:hypothetical protein